MAHPKNDEPKGLPPTSPAVSVLVLPSYRTAVEPSLVDDLAHLGYQAEIIRVEANAQDNRSTVDPPFSTASFRRCRLPAPTTPFLAMLFGLCYCRADLIILASGGIRLAAEEVAILLRRQQETSAEVVVAARFGAGSRSNHPWRYRLLTAIVREYLRLLTGSPLRDPRSGLKLFQRDSLAALVRNVHRSGIPFDPHDLILFASRGRQTIVEVPVEARFGDAPFGISIALARHVVITPLRRRAAIFRRQSHPSQS